MDEQKIKLNILKKLRKMSFSELNNEEIIYANKIMQFLEICLSVEIK